MNKPIRCIKCFKQRPGGRCDYCPLHKRNRHLYRYIGEGWYLPISSNEIEKKHSEREHRDHDQ
jgi:hypothetical protein